MGVATARNAGLNCQARPGGPCFDPQEQSPKRARKARMAQQRSRVVSIGEVMIELTRGGDGRFGIGCGGDTFNTAVYLARAGAEVAYATALGDDPYSDRILALAAAENVARDLV